MAEMLLARAPQGLVPLPESEAEFAKLGDGEVIRVKWTRPRQLWRHRKFFALLQVVLEQQEFFVTTDQMLIDLKIRTGHCDLFIRQNGEVVYQPKSINFASMDDSEFKAFYDAVLTIVVREYVRGADPREFDRAAEAIIGFC
jgi:hypothetical protein